MPVDSASPPRRSARIYRFPPVQTPRGAERLATSSPHPMPAALRQRALELFQTGLCDARTMALQGRLVVRRQAVWLDQDEPELSERLHAHASEKDSQIARVEAVLEAMGIGLAQASEVPEIRAPGLHNAMLSFGGAMSALLNVVNDGEVLKNALTTAAMIQFEIAAYDTLLMLGEASEQYDALPPLSRSQAEEQAMGDWLAAILRPLTLRQLEREDEFALSPWQR